MAKVEATQKLDPATGEPTGERSGAKIVGIALCIVGMIVVLLAAVSVLLHPIFGNGEIPISDGVKYGGAACLLGAAIYGGEISGILDRLPKFGGS